MHPFPGLARRDFLQQAIAGFVGCSATASLTASATVAAADPPRRPSLGFSLYGMKSLPLETALRACSEIGYSHVEFCLNAGYPTEPERFSAAARRETTALLQQLKLEVPGLMVLMSLVASDEAHRRSLDLIATAAELGRDVVPPSKSQAPPLLETVLGGQPAKWEEQKEGMARQLADWASAAEKARVSIAIKAHVGSAVNSPSRLLWLLDQVKSPAIQAAYDYSHFELQGLALAGTLEALLPRTRFIHVKDSVGDAAKFQFLLPGAGRTDYVQYFSLLRQHAYSGPVCVEVSGQVSSQPGYDPLAAARQCYAALSAALDQAYRSSC